MGGGGGGAKMAGKIRILSPFLQRAATTAGLTAQGGSRARSFRSGARSFRAGRELAAIGRARSSQLLGGQEAHSFRAGRELESLERVWSSNLESGSGAQCFRKGQDLALWSQDQGLGARRFRADQEL